MVVLEYTSHLYCFELQTGFYSQCKLHTQLLHENKTFPLMTLLKLVPRVVAPSQYDLRSVDKGVDP